MDECVDWSLASVCPGYGIPVQQTRAATDEGGY